MQTWLAELYLRCQVLTILNQQVPTYKNSEVGTRCQGGTNHDGEITGLVMYLL